MDASAPFGSCVLSNREIATTQVFFAMAQLSLECPHCRTEKIGFAPRGAWLVKPGTSDVLLFLQCEGCGQGVTAIVSPTNVSNVNAWIMDSALSPGNIQRTYPEVVALRSPADVPPQVSAAYLSGLDNLGRKGGTNAAAIMFRRAIEIAVKTINPAASKGDNLKKRIEDLPPDVATPAMKTLAQHVRLDANDAAHEPEEFSEDDAKKLQVFAEMFLTYAFTLPEMLKRASPPPIGKAP